MTSPALGGQRGFSLQELAVIGVLVTFLLGVFFVRYINVQALAERTAHAAVLQGINNALILKAAELASRQGASRVAQLATINPFDLLAERPANYRGELIFIDELQPGNWGYTRDAMEVIYAWRWTQAEFPSPDSSRLDRYRVNVRIGAGVVDSVSIQPAGFSEQEK